MKERDLFQRINDFIRDFDERAGRAVKKVVLPATLGLGMALGTGCGVQDDPGQTRPPATRAQKGDTGDMVALYAAPFPGQNSCQDSCGAQAPGGCWCDDGCVTYGDCCDDKAALCDELEPPVALYAAPMPQPEYAAPFPEPEQATCVSGDKSYCGEQAPAGCWCDDECATYGDCCDDRVGCEMQALYAAPFPADEP